MGVLEAQRAGAGVGATGVEDDGGDRAALEDLLGPEHGGGLDPVGGEDAGRGERGAVVDDQGEVRGAGGLDPGGDAGRPEAQGRGHADVLVVGHGATPFTGRPSSSGRPRAMFMLCTAPPAVPLTRLSIALIATIRPAAPSRATCTSAVLAP